MQHAPGHSVVAHSVSGPWKFPPRFPHSVAPTPPEPGPSAAEDVSLAHVEISRRGSPVASNLDSIAAPPKVVVENPRVREDVAPQELRPTSSPATRVIVERTTRVVPEGSNAWDPTILPADLGRERAPRALAPDVFDEDPFSPEEDEELLPGPEAAPLPPPSERQVSIPLD